MPRYSVLLPTRNGASLLEGTLRSVLDQPSEDFELVVSDNASDDGTAEILAEAAADPRLRVLRQPRPLGVTDNWNAALGAAEQLIINLGGIVMAGVVTLYIQNRDYLARRREHLGQS